MYLADELSNVDIQKFQNKTSVSLNNMVKINLNAEYFKYPHIKSLFATHSAACMQFLFHFLQYCGSIFKSRIHCLYMDIRKILKTQPETGYYNILKCFLFFIKKEEEKIVAGSAGLVKYGSNRIHKACFTLYCAALSEKTAVGTELFRSLKIAASRSAASW